MTPSDLQQLAEDCAMVARGAVAVAFVAVGLAVALNHRAAWLIAALLLANLALAVRRLP